ncbi:MULTISPECIES: NAD(P)-dependent alcohol dehydrogenase [Arthrobacter]|uniref:NAD(P)-dependent alcohol dehydrogenase n=1 Tax=Arthrobacter terricola TaxID=2547396 RepID=A0A4R5KSK3_9MICC|nr:MULTISPECIES: NAD(P)-dependent alcohol dehydrogenase [Arthrobacter]MBT8160557.1 NAD(P)-dependent alcohol dehydrogenase [Arthrobacter sp. GN70]TDF98412.1 NAD(P)-dependent alcohol dehydrogenase [Arthrobacter terricola]
MKAIVQDAYGSPDVLQLSDIEQPVPGENEVLIRVHAAGVDPGVWHLMTGLPYLTRLFGFGLTRPKNRVRGRDVAGVVEEVGAKVVGFRPGDAVFGTCEGSFAEYVCAKQDKIAPKPTMLSFEQAAAVPISATTALQGLRSSGKAQSGEKVLVIGAGGGVGLFAVQMAKAFGADVTGVCSTSKVELVRQAGAGHVIDHAKEDFTDGPERFDLILDTAGNRPLKQLRKALTPRGRLVIVGGEGGGRWLGGFQRGMGAPLHSLFRGQNFSGLIAVERQDDLQAVSALINAGKVTPVIDRTFLLPEAPDAIRYAHEGGVRGKVVVTVVSEG